MSDSPAKKDLSREQFVVECRADIERLRAAGADPEIIEVYAGLLIIHGHGNDPAFFADLYYRYFKEGFMSFRAAALGALYSFIAAPTKDPFEAIYEGDIDIAIPFDGLGMGKAPAWVLRGLFEGVHEYLTHTSGSLNQAFQISGGTKGAAQLDLPLRDLSTVENMLISKLARIQSGEMLSTSAAAIELEVQATLLTGSDKTEGYNERSSRSAWRRIHQAFADHD